MELFQAYQDVNSLICRGDEKEARDQLIKLLDYHERNDIIYPAVLNRLIRDLGLYPYLKTNSANWQERYIHEVFKVDVGTADKVTLHREQSKVLKKLLAGASLAVSAPTSFGKSFIIDSFIAQKKPKNIVIIVPTIALTDETRRRLTRKFSKEYKVITTSDVGLAEKNIFVFPQERAVHYLSSFDELDMLVIDEFYKASPKHDKERSPSLLNAILKLGKKAKQKYFLAPNISGINESMFTRGVEFLHIDFNTVYLEKHEIYKKINGDEGKKSEELLRILDGASGKSLIYAGTYPNIEKVSNLIVANSDVSQSGLLKGFSEWLMHNYDPNWSLTNLVKRATGIHNGQLHRSLSQIQIRLFEEEVGLKNIISTSSIIEGVNTSAENVIIWGNKNGQYRLTDFSYKNIMGRGGRMFRHFVGKIFILEEPPSEETNQLDLALPESLLGDIDEKEMEGDLTDKEIEKIVQYRAEMQDLLGRDGYRKLRSLGLLESVDCLLLLDVVRDIVQNKDEWKGIGYLNSENPNDWERMLYKIIRIQPGAWGIEYSKFVGFIKILSGNWSMSIPELLRELDAFNIGINEFFKLERVATFKMSSLLNDVNEIQKIVLEGAKDISGFVSRVSNAFLPTLVYQLEEYGLPRMLSKKIQQSGIIDLTEDGANLHEKLEEFKFLDLETWIHAIDKFDEFDKYIFSYFYEGVAGRE